MKKFFCALFFLTMLTSLVYPVNANCLSCNENPTSDDTDNNKPYLNDVSTQKEGNYQTNGDQIVTSKPFSFLPRASRPDIGNGGGVGAGTYNWVYSWTQYIMKNYNCYAFALNLKNDFYDPGYSSGCNGSLGTLSVSKIYHYIIRDLIYEGYANVREVSSTYQPNSNETKIAFRRGYDVETGNYVDYHFMALDNTGYWLHKPGATAILIRMNKSPASAWKVEYYDGSYKIEDSFVYNGTISYFAFS